MVKLNSVGSILDTKTTMVYPEKNDSTPDLNSGVYLEDLCEEWFNSLDDKDKKIVNICLDTQGLEFIN